jgi:hypothetical protein|tara:strand:+ start:672 stop:806 length:135 start_codon:yes stop_codon:yes gene_type:complete
MVKILIGVSIGYLVFKYNIGPEVLDFFVETGAVDKTIESLEGLK